MKVFCLSLFNLSLIISCQNAKKPENSGSSPKEVSTQTMKFEMIPSNVSGVSFSNDIHEDFTFNYFNYGYIYNGGGVSAGDINNDGLPDLYFGSTLNENKLYLNKGNFRFEEITEKAGVAAKEGFKTGVVMHDFNNDGFLDIYVCKSGDPNLGDRNNLLFINNGDLSFTEKAAEFGLRDNSNTTQIALIDYDLDGDLDIYMVNHPIQFGTNNRPRIKPTPQGYVRLTDPENSAESDKLFRNNGDNTYSDVSRQAGISNRAFGLSAVVHDFNEDGKPDVYVGNDFIEPDFLYLNLGDGKFREAYEEHFRHISQNSMGADIADFNNDGNDDLVVLDMIAEDNERQKSLMTTMSLNRYSTLVNFGYGHQVMRNVLQMNNGDGSFSEIGQMAGISNTDWSWGPIFADFDLDGYKDIFIANGYRRDVANLDFIKFKNDSINKRGGLSIAEMESVYDVLDKIPANKIKNYMYQNSGNIKFNKVTDQWGLGEPSFSNGAIYADLDDDGDLDLVINNLDSEAMIYENKNQKGRGWLKINFEGPENNIYGIGSRVRLVADDLVQYYTLHTIKGFLSSVEPVIFSGFAEISNIDTLEVFWPDNAYQALFDIKLNQTLTLKYNEAKEKPIRKSEGKESLWISSSVLTDYPFIHKEDDFIDYKRDPLLPRQHSRLGPALCKGDINNDGLTDFFIGGAARQESRFYIQQSGGSFTPVIFDDLREDARYEDVDAILFDANGDAFPDLYVVSGGSHEIGLHEVYEDRLYINNEGRGFKRSSSIPKILTVGSCVKNYDFDGDGDQDLFIGGRIFPGSYPHSPLSYLLQNDNGTFTDVTNTRAPGLQKIGMVSDAEWADIDNDGKSELCLIGEWMHLNIFKYDGRKFSNISKDYQLQNSTGWWNSLLAVDYDNDGDIDFIAGNHGLNSRFTANPATPLEMYAADYDNNGKVDPVMTWYIDNKKWPVPLKDALVSQIPSIKKKFVKYRAYSKAGIYDVFDEKDLNNAYHLTCNNLASSVFINQGGRFDVIPLPELAQTAPVYDILSSNSLNSQKNDLILVGNDFLPEIESGRNDAFCGLLLTVDENNSFQVTKGKRSGLRSMRDGRRIELVKRDELPPILIIANNNDKMEILELNSNLIEVDQL